MFSYSLQEIWEGLHGDPLAHNDHSQYFHNSFYWDMIQKPKNRKLSLSYCFFKTAFDREIFAYFPICTIEDVMDRQPSAGVVQVTQLYRNDSAAT